MECINCKYRCNDTCNFNGLCPDISNNTIRDDRYIEGYINGINKLKEAIFIYIERMGSCNTDAIEYIVKCLKDIEIKRKV